MNKKRKESANMFFSAFLVIAYVVCSYFLIQLASSLANQTLIEVIIIALIVVFGAFLFYATRVGDGKQILRFSPAVLILMVLPSIYVISAYFAVGLPFHTQISSTEPVLYLAAVTLGYAIPYTFTSGFELVSAEDVYYPNREEKSVEKDSDADETSEEKTDKAESDDEDAKPKKKAAKSKKEK